MATVRQTLRDYFRHLPSNPGALVGRLWRGHSELIHPFWHLSFSTGKGSQGKISLDATDTQPVAWMEGQWQWAFPPLLCWWQLDHVMATWLCSLLAGICSRVDAISSISVLVSLIFFPKVFKVSEKTWRERFVLFVTRKKSLCIECQDKDWTLHKSSRAGNSIVLPAFCPFRNLGQRVNHFDTKANTRMQLG